MNTISVRRENGGGSVVTATASRSDDPGFESGQGEVF
jgi:hypothetical protein